jgi:hypothetical protein
MKNFALGGTIVSSISYLATYFDPLLAAIWWSFPLSLLPSLWYMKQNNKLNKDIAHFALSTTYALILLVISTLGLYYFFNTEKKHFWLPVVKASLIWFIAAIIFYYLVKYFNLETKFL